ncbi:MAG: class 1 fructose-bisphosphatase, partial [Myxococcales bacterium]|nr:class 1 fructose-bisphosphatase [Myxococcales bacterium]
GLAGLLGYTSETNVQGEEVQKLDAFSNEVLLNVLQRSGHCGVIASEELDEAIIENNHGRYVALFDPLDGSSNIDTNVGIGTIFAILRRSEPKLTPPTLADALRPGREIAAAGYVLYGPSTLFVLSTGQGAHGFTLDPSIGEFFLSQPDIRCPDRGNCYSVNEGNYSRWTPEIQSWARWVKGDGPAIGADKDGEAPKTPYGARYVGSLVADAHRTLMKGGIFAYPADSKSKNGKLRLLYEANPMAFLFEQAGGGATNGKDRILDIMPTELHQRTPLVIGSKDDVAAYRQFMVGERS